MSNDKTTSAPTKPDAKGDIPAVRKPDVVTEDGPAGEEAKPDPTRFGDWEKNGRCIDF